MKKGRILLSAALFALLLPERAPAAPLVIDHTVVDRYADIPQQYIDEVKKMWLNIPGESHSQGYRLGTALLEAADSRFQVNVTESGTPEPYTDRHLRISRASWGDLTHGTNWRYGYGEEDWYTSAAAVARTKAHLAYGNSNGLEIAAMGFAWCWDMTWHNAPGGGIDPLHQVRWAGSSVSGPDGDRRWGLDGGDAALTGNSVSLATYLSATEQYIAYAAAQGYRTRVFFTTGPVDGGGNTGEAGYQRYLKHKGVRDYVNLDGDAVLFDYADILTWGNDGGQNTVTWTDHGGTLRTFPFIHPDNMLDLDGTYVEDGDHIGERGALRLGKALWYMLARMAGWDGTEGGGYTLSVNVIGDGTVTADQGAIDCGGTCSDSFPAGTTVTVTAAPAAGSTFTGWSGGGCYGTADCTVTMNGKTSVTATFVPADGPDRQPGDWNGDGRPDMAWRHEGGENLLVYCDDVSLVGRGRLPSLQPPWRMAAAADFNGDRKMDLLWHHPPGGLVVASYFDGTRLLGWDTVFTVKAPWEVCGSGDMDGDGWTDLVLCNTATGENEVRYLVGATPVGAAGLPAAPPPWRIAAVDDLDGDGFIDLVARNPVSGRNAVAYLKGKLLQRIKGLPPAEPPWEIAGTGDHDGDGWTDILLHNPATRENRVWHMRNRVRLGEGSLKNSAPGWQGMSGRR